MEKKGNVNNVNLAPDHKDNIKLNDINESPFKQFRIQTDKIKKFLAKIFIILIILIIIFQFFF